LDDLVTGVQTCALPIFVAELLWQPPASARLVTRAPVSASTGFLPISVLSPVLDRCHRAAARARPGRLARARWAAVPEKRWGYNGGGAGGQEERPDGRTGVRGLPSWHVRCCQAMSRVPTVRATNACRPWP